MLSFSGFAQMQQPFGSSNSNLGSMQGANANGVNQRVNEQAARSMKTMPSSTDREQSNKEINEVNQDSYYQPKASRLIQESRFKNAYAELYRMYVGSQPFRIKRAVFITENAYLDRQMTYDEFNSQIAYRVKLLDSIMRKEKIANNDLGKNFAIQKLYSDGIYNKGILIHPPFTYDFNDPFGDNDRTKPFVIKLLAKGNGQCISMPLLYLILAEELNAKAWLALAPEHSFIVFKDCINGHSYNFETTNGHITSDNWVMASGYINANDMDSLNSWLLNPAEWGK